MLGFAWHGAHETGRLQGVSPESSAARAGSFINARAKGQRKRGEIFFFLLERKSEGERQRERERYHQGGSFIGSELTYFHRTMNSASRPMTTISTASYHKQVVFQPVPARSGRVAITCTRQLLLRNLFTEGQLQPAAMCS